ncbi:DNA ligase 4, partial [Bonamia ostreae]
PKFSCVLDGEIVVWNNIQNKFESFGFNKFAAKTYRKPQNANNENNENSLRFIAFDIIYKNGHFLTEKPFFERRKILEKTIKTAENKIFVAKQTVFENKISKIALLKLLERFLNESLEGIVLKNMKSEYLCNDRSKNWIKLKPDYVETIATDLDLIVIGCFIGKNGNVSELLVGLRDIGKFFNQI